MSIKDLIEKRAKAWEAAKDFTNTHAKDGVLSAEDTATYEKMENEISDLTKAIEREQRAAEVEAMLAKPIDTPAVSKPESGVKDTKAARIVDTEEYKAAMCRALRTNFSNVAIDGMNESTDSEGGYLVPTEYDRRLIDVLNEANVVRSMATVIRTSGERKINIAANKPAAAWLDEGEALTFGEATFSQITLDAFKLAVAIKVTEELLYDSVIDLESYIIKAFGDALANAEEDAFLNGDGSGKPTGIFDTTNGGHYNTAANSIKTDNVIDLVYALKRPYRARAQFLMKDSTVAALRKLKDATGNYIWQPSMIAGEPDRILGYPVKTSAYAPEDKIAFGDFSYYNIGDRGSRSFKPLRELFAGNGMIGYVAKERVDGKVVLAEAIQILPIT
jgi:HK97 family phage major capsid protein